VKESIKSHLEYDSEKEIELEFQQSHINILEGNQRFGTIGIAHLQDHANEENWIFMIQNGSG
jgi:hypothetical protein